MDTNEQKSAEHEVDSISLLACPFCGDENPRQTPDIDKDPYTWCTNQCCGAYDIEIHIDTWQKRVG